MYEYDRQPDQLSGNYYSGTDNTDSRDTDTTYAPGNTAEVTEPDEPALTAPEGWGENDGATRAESTQALVPAGEVLEPTDISRPEKQQAPKLTPAEAKAAADFLGYQGCEILGERSPLQGLAERKALQAGHKIVKEYIAQNNQPDSEDIDRISNGALTFEAATARTADEARALLDQYDHLHPAETSDEQLERKQRVMDRWATVKTLEGYAADTEQLTPEVQGAGFELPDGYEITVVETTAVAVRYDSVEEAKAALDKYNAEILVTTPERIPETQDFIGRAPGERFQDGEFRVSPSRDGSYSVLSFSRYPDLGVRAVERLATVTGKAVDYSPSFKVAFQAPMPAKTWRGLEPTVVPMDDIVNTVANVLDAPRVAETPRESQSYRHYDILGGGSLQMAGSFNDDGTLYAPDVRYRPNEHTPPHFSIDVDLGYRNSTEASRSMAARRLAAWFKVQTGRPRTSIEQ